MRAFARLRPLWRVFTWISLGLAGLAGACSLRPAGLEADTGVGQNPPMFRNLAVLPETPPAVPAEIVDQAVQSLTADRARAAAAAEELRRESFIVPQPAPPQSGF